MVNSPRVHSGDSPVGSPIAGEWNECDEEAEDRGPCTHEGDYCWDECDCECEACWNGPDEEPYEEPPDEPEVDAGSPMLSPMRVSSRYADRSPERIKKLHAQVLPVQSCCVFKQCSRWESYRTRYSNY